MEKQRLDLVTPRTEQEKDTFKARVCPEGPRSWMEEGVEDDLETMQATGESGCGSEGDTGGNEELTAETPSRGRCSGRGRGSEGI